MVFNIVDLFAGIGGLSYGFHNHKEFDIILANEIDKNASLTYKKNFPDTRVVIKSIYDILEAEILEYVKNTKVDIIMGGCPCFLADTKVVTEDGYLNIQDVKLDNKLLTHTGKFQNIVNLQRKLYTGDIYKIQVKYHPLIISCTENHPFYCIERKQKQKKWIKAKELTNNHMVGIPINTNSIVPQFRTEQVINQFKTVDIITELNESNHWWMLGYWVGDGWVEDVKKKDNRLCYTIKFAIADKDNDKILSKIKTVLPIKYRESSGKSKKYECKSKVWYNILKHFGKYAHDKLIPEWVQDAPKEFIQEFLDGYQTADGCIIQYQSDKSNDVISYTTVSPHLAYGVQRLYLKLGKLCGITHTKRPPTCVIEGRIVNQRDTYQMRVTIGDSIRQSSSFIDKDNDYVWYTIPKIEKETKIEPMMVYNFEVEEDHSYCVENVIVHNCQSYSTSGKRQNDGRATLYEEYYRILKILNPTLFIFENVTGLVSFKTKKGDCLLPVIMELFRSLKYDVSYRIMKCVEFGIPQERERLIMIGTKIGHKSFTYPIPPERFKNNPVTMAEALSDMMPLKANEATNKYKTSPQTDYQRFIRNDKDYCTYHSVPNHNDKLIELMGLLPDGGTTKDLSLDKRPTSGYGNSYAKLWWNKPATTITRNFGTPSSARCIHPRDSRALTSREGARLQSFPDTFEFVGTRGTINLQIGNAVPPLLSKYLADSVYECLK